MKDKTIDDCINGRSLNVNLVNPPIAQPWKTRKEYMNDDKMLRVGIICSVISTSTSVVIVIATLLQLQ
ncbi:MAG: hypothetical protein COA78_21055 [Blastopirellula sp.]|nr:MAG: hypothetical protein COA78_21055 [Blastopirellula sp.]